MSAEDKSAHATMVKRRTLGTIRFIGELYIRHLIASRILRHCVVLLCGDINAPVEEDIETLCRLLDTTGKVLELSNKGKDSKVNHEFLHTTLAQLAQLKERRELLSSRIRFMIADVLDVQKSGWVNRRAADQAKKISAVHEEAARQEREAAQQAELQRMYQSMHQQTSNASRPSPASRMARPTDRYALPPPPTQPGQWEMVGGGGGKAKQGAAAAAAISKHSASPKRGADNDSNEEANAYALLNRRGAEEKEEEDEDDEEDEDEEEEEAEAEDGNKAKQLTPGDAAASLSADALHDRAGALVKELCNSEDVNDALLTVEELGAANRSASWIEGALLAALETKKESHKLMVCRLLGEAHKRKLLSASALEGGVIALLKAVDDIAIDLPKADEYAAIFIAQLAADSALSLSALTPAVLQSVSTQAGASGRFFLTVLQQMKRLTGGEEAVVAAVRHAQSDSSRPLRLLAVLDSSADAARKQLVDKKLQQVAEQCLNSE